MTIRSEQIEVLGQDMFRRFVDRMCAYLRSNFEQQTINTSDDELRRTVMAGIEKAETYNVTDEADVQRYLEYVVGYGADFDTAPWAAPILKKRASGMAKMNDLDDSNICRISGARK